MTMWKRLAMSLAALAFVVGAVNPVQADHFWPCDDAPEWMYEEWANGNGLYLFMWLNWRGSEDGIADCGS